MPWIFIVVLSVHVLAAVFWAGSTFAIARTGGDGAERLFVAQMASAIVSVLTGGYLVHLLHQGPFGRTEEILSVAAVSALVALAVQGAIAGRALAALRRQTIDESTARSRLATAYRISAILLVVAVIGMTVARYV